MLVLYAIVLAIFSVYSYVLVEPGFEPFQNPALTALQHAITNFGHTQRSASVLMYLLLISALLFFHLWFVKRAKSINLKSIVIVAGVILFFSYPFLSRDIFNYMFYAKIVTFYHQNPYAMNPLSFPSDPSLKYVVVPHILFPYGPTYLAVSLIPSLLSGGNMIASYFLFKLLSIGTYATGAYILGKWKKEWGVFFATSPIILVEGVINAHNDLFTLTVALWGIYFLFHKKEALGRVFLLLAGFIKFFGLPLSIIGRTHKSVGTILALGLTIGMLFVIAASHGIFPWYFLVLFAFIPYWFDVIKKYQFFYFGLLLSYVFYIETGEWFLAFFYQMIFGSLVINFIYNMTNGFFIRRIHKK